MNLQYIYIHIICMALDQLRRGRWFKLLCTWPLDIVWCALRRGTLSTSSQSTKLKLGTTCSIRWGLTCERQVSYPLGIKDSHPLSTTEAGDKHQPYAPSWL